MTDEICSQGHVLDFGARTCSRCGGQAIGFTQNPPVLEEEKQVLKEVEPESVIEEELKETVEEETVEEKPKKKKGKKKKKRGAINNSELTSAEWRKRLDSPTSPQIYVRRK